MRGSRQRRSPIINIAYLAPFTRLGYTQIEPMEYPIGRNIRSQLRHRSIFLIGLCLITLSSVLACTPRPIAPEQIEPPEPTPAPIENKLLALVLSRCIGELIPAKYREEKYGQDYFYPVYPSTFLNIGRTESEHTIKPYILSRFSAKDFMPLIDQLIERNEKRVRLTIRSSLKDHYFIDYDLKLSAYFFGKDTWKNLQADYPKALDPFVTVSLPVFDEATGNGLIFYLLEFKQGSQMRILQPFRFKDEQFTKLLAFWPPV
jgi:hypothetical protein